MYNPNYDTAEKMNSVGLKLQDELYKDYLQKQADEFAKKRKKLEEINGHEDRVFEESRDAEDRFNKLS